MLLKAIGIVALGTVIGFHTLHKKPEYHVIQPVQELGPIPGDTPYGQNCDYKGKFHGEDLWECFPEGRNANDSAAMFNLALNQLPQDILAWAANDQKAKRRR